LLLGPVFTEPAFRVGVDVAGEDGWDAQLRSMRLLVTVNLLGLPAGAVPTGLTNGLPQGVQIIGDRFREDLCLDAAEVIESWLGSVTPFAVASRCRVWFQWTRSQALRALRRRRERGGRMIRVRSVKIGRGGESRIPEEAHGFRDLRRDRTPARST
jgi:hypothetical protein